VSEVSLRRARVCRAIGPQKQVARLLRLQPHVNVGGVKNTLRNLLVLALVAAGAAHAQTAGVVTLRANATSATGSFVPVLTWSTNPVATSCRSSGGWSGTRAASGTATLPAISANTNYTLTCSWGTGSAAVSWVAPTTNTDGSALTDLAGFRIYYGTSSTSLTQSMTLNNVAARSATVSPLAPGTWYFTVRAFNTSQAESNDSNVVSKPVAGATAAQTVSITITSGTQTRKTIATSVYDVIRNSSGRWVLGRVVGSIPIGRPCRTYHLSGDYYGVRTGYVTITVTPRNTTLVARCALS
jgi:hypothetical protein